MYILRKGLLKHQEHWLLAPKKVTMLARLATTVSGIFLTIYGVVAAISPLPLGVPLIILGHLLIAAANPAARPLVLHLRRRWQWFDYLVRKASRRSPARFQETFEETDPANHPIRDKDDSKKPD